MKFLKKSLIFGMFMAVAMFFAPVSQTKKTADAAILPDMFNYVTISKNNQTLTAENFLTTETESYIVSNGSMTVTLKPFLNNYFVDETLFNAANFVVSYDEIEVSKDEESFVYDDITYYYRVETNGSLSIYKNSPTSSSSSPFITADDTGTNIISYDNVAYEDENQDTFKIFCKTSYTLKSTSDDTSFRFSVTRITNEYTINFLRPVVNFAGNSNPIVNFRCNGVDAGESEYSDTAIRREQTYNTVSVEFLNNNYTEDNRLYFDINYNGFTYNFQLYSKVYGSDNLLFVNYLDPEKESNNKYLATKLFLNGNNEYEVDQPSRVFANIASDFNTFLLSFTKTGRYQIDIYDSTYLTGMNNPNYYSTSFYILDEHQTAFENIYMISQTFDDENKPIEYIVSTSTLNNVVKTTIKNLNIPNLENVIEKIDFRKTTFGGSSNIPTTTEYSISEIKKFLTNSNDMVLTFEEDAYYEITIYQKGTRAIKYYEFTIVKHAKTTFTIPLVDANGEPIFTEEGKQASTTYEAETPFKTEIKNYSKNILSSMDLTIKYKSDVSNSNQTLNKTYINNYTISYGMEQVLIEQFERKLEEGEKKVDEINIRVKGVGKLTVDVTFNGKTTRYELNSEEGVNTLRFTEYGSYKIRLVDSMGTETTKIVSLDKKLNLSAIALIVLSSIIAAVVILFVLKARSKLPTR